MTSVRINEKKKKEYIYLQIFSSVRINEQKQKNTEYIIYI